MPKPTEGRKFISVPVSPEEYRRAQDAAEREAAKIGVRMPLAQYARRALNERVAADTKGKR